MTQLPRGRAQLPMSRPPRNLFLTLGLCLDEPTEKRNATSSRPLQSPSCAPGAQVLKMHHGCSLFSGTFGQQRRYSGQNRKTGRSGASPGGRNFTREEHSRDQKTLFSICCFVSHSGCSIWARTDSSAAHTTAGSSNRKSHFCQPKQDVHNAQRHVNHCRRENA